jgi:carbon-monoxide dehydrogenase large subunit
VVAESPQAAADAADLVWADIEPLPAVSSIGGATAEGAPVIWPEIGSNVVHTDAGTGSSDPFGEADVVVAGDFRNQRVAPIPLEGNSALAIPRDDGRLEVWVGTQNVFSHRHTIARALDVERAKVRGRVPDMGGGFGAKFYSYPEQILTAVIATELGKPVKWIERRGENLVGMVHGRAMTQHVEIGAKRDGTIVGLRVAVDQEVGAYPSFGAVLPTFTRLMASGPYRIPKVDFSYRAVATNTTTVHAYRGAGRPEATAFLERILDMLARHLDVDPVELRRRNFFAPEDFPLETVTGARYDSGDYEKAMNEALRIAGYDELRAEQARRRSSGARRQLGIGLSSYVEVTAPDGSHEWGAADVHEDGTVTVRVGTSAHGQGHETAFAQIAGGIFNVPYTDVRVVFGDTDVIPLGEGTGGSRSLQLGGSAVQKVSVEVVDKAREIVAFLEEAAVGDVVVFENGTVGVAGVPDTAIGWGDLAAIASDRGRLPEGMEPGLGAEGVFDQGGSTYPFGTHISVVEVDIETGDVELSRHVAVDDAGNILNRWLLDGQVHGGIAQGVGQALFEEMRYDEDANPLTANLVSYILPMAPNLPSFEVAHTETPTPMNPLGVKGIGEAATIGSTVAVQNAVVDALSHLGVRHIDMPLTPARVWAAISAAG